MVTTLSARGKRSFSAYDVSISEITDNVYDVESNPSGVISLALSENVSFSAMMPWETIADRNDKHLIQGHVVDFINKHVSNIS